MDNSSRSGMMVSVVPWYQGLEAWIGAMTTLSETEITNRWLDQFEKPDRETAELLVEEILLVQRDEFYGAMRAMLDEVVSQRRLGDGKIALYAERPIKKVFGKIHAFFPGSHTGRATGSGVSPIIVDPRDQEVGSEGLVAQLITDFCRSNPHALSHPGPDKMRKEKVSHIVILTDFIGSGSRIHDMLEAFRYVRTLRSWRSYKLLNFVVIAYSATTTGIQAVRWSKLKPDIKVRTGCPTIYSTFRRNQREKIYNLVNAYPPGNKAKMGWLGGGALIAFAHGCPNNAPAMLWSRANGWKPLFPGRSTSAAADAFQVDADQLMNQRAERLLGIKTARNELTSPTTKLWISTLMVLAASSEGIKVAEDISGGVGIPIADVKRILEFSKVARWLSAKGSITALGRRELARLRRREQGRPVLPNAKNRFYYPGQLRVP